MSSVVSYISSFIQRAGSYVFVSTILSRLLSFFASWVALQMIPNAPLGEALYAWNFIVFLTPLVGFGLHQSCIRYGAIYSKKEEQELLFNYVIKKGILTSSILTIGVFLFGLLYNFNADSISKYVMILSLVFIPTYLFEFIKVRVRLAHQNKKFAELEIVYNLILVLTVALGSYFLHTLGYVISFIAAPLLSTFFYLPLLKTNSKKNHKPSFINIEFWKYGFFGGLSNVVTLFLVAIDILLIGSLLNDSEQVTVYRYISLLPFSLLFLPRIFMTTDFVSFTEQINNPTFIQKYSKGYLILFSILSAVIFLFFIIFGTYLLQLFDQDLAQYIDSFIILTFGICGILILRGLYGNLLSSIGQVKMNFYITSAAVVMNYFSNQYLIPTYGIKGAAITSATLMWLTGIASYILFKILYKRFLSTL